MLWELDTIGSAPPGSIVVHIYSSDVLAIYTQRNPVLVPSVDSGSRGDRRHHTRSRG